MGSIAFLVMLTTYGLVLYWYILNVERGQDAKDGIIGMRDRPVTSEPVEAAEKERELPHAVQSVRRKVEDIKKSAGAEPSIRATPRPSPSSPEPQSSEPPRRFPLQ